MAINVVCPGCLKRFQVSDRFAGMKGPCPNCNTVINIPKAQVKIHGTEEFEQGGRTATGKLILKPIDRIDMDFNPTHAGLFALGALAVFLGAVLLGSLSLSTSALDWIGVLGVFCVAFPLSLFGYLVLRDREALFILTGLDLYKQIGICALVYATLWVLFESVAWYMRADEIFIWLYFAAFAFLSMLATHAVLDLNLAGALLHYLIFFVPVLILRGVMGLGWLWNVTAEMMRPAGSSAPPPPILPGM